MTRPEDLIAANVRREADRRGVTMTSLAEALGIGKSTLYRRLDGVGDPWSYAELVGAAVHLDCRLGDLTLGVEAAYREQIAATRTAAQA